MTVSDPWLAAKAVIGDTRVLAGPQASQQWLEAPEHLAMVLARYRAAAALIGDAKSVLEIGCGEGIGARILAKGRRWYVGVDSDRPAIEVARAQSHGLIGQFYAKDAFDLGATMDDPLGFTNHATVMLDVIEHIPAASEDELMRRICDNLDSRGVCVIGTPSASFEHLASPQSKAGHVNLYTHGRLRNLMRLYFHVVQSFGMNDVSLHTGHPDARHYLMAVGISPR